MSDDSVQGSSTGLWHWFTTERRRRWHVPAVTSIVLLAAFLVLVEPWREFWRWPGARSSQINEQIDLPDIHDLECFVWRDTLFAVILSVAIIVVAIWLNHQHQTYRPRVKPTVGRWRTRARKATKANWLLVATVLVGVGYLVADLVENRMLYTLLDEQRKREVTGAQARHLAQAANTKWAFLILSILGVVALVQRRPPARQPTKQFDSRPDRAPDASWQPDGRRLGIAVTGGGIRAASFAHGVFQVLRERELLSKARYVTSVSGGGYMAGAITAVNQDPPGEDEPPIFSPHSPEEQRLRRRLRYIASDWSVLLGAISRIIFGVLLNLLLLYLLLWVLLRPVGWLIGSPLVHPELRLDDPIAVEIERTDSDPDREPDAAQPWNQSCDLSRPPETTSLTVAGEPSLISINPRRRAIELDVTVGDQCILATTPDGEERQPMVVGVEQDQPAVLTIEGGDVTVARQPTVRFADSTCPKDPPADGDENGDDNDGDENGDDSIDENDRCQTPSCTPPSGNAVMPAACVAGLTAAAADEMLTLQHPVIEVSPSEGVTDLAGVAALAEVTEPARIDLKNIIDRRDPLDIDPSHWWIPGVLISLATLFLAVRVIIRPDRWRECMKFATWTGVTGLVAFAVLVALPWLVDQLPRAVLQGASTSPSEESWGSVDWLPIPTTAVPNLLAWPLLSVAAIWRFMQGRSDKSSEKPKRSTSTAALFKKILRLARAAAVGIILFVAAGATAISILASGALNGPKGNFGVVLQFIVDLPPLGLLRVDLWQWVLAALFLIVMIGVGEAAAWSLAPIYKRRLAHAFSWRRTGSTAEARDYAKPRHPGADTQGQLDPQGRQRWAMLTPSIERPDDDGDAAPLPASDDGDAEDRGDRSGYLDGEHGDGTELVLCCAANILGEDRAPTGRSAVSFTISRSWIGGPEVRWMPADEYVGRMGRRREWDFTLPGAVAISGAAAAPAMGKKAIGPIGSILAMLNVRLGAWVPHPAWVQGMDEGRRWEHNPGWTWFVREVIRRYRWEAPYLYVSDGGHWENLGLVEALRRGCTQVISISAGGDGRYSHAAIASAIEIARTDLGVEIELDQVWSMRPEVGKEGSGFTSGRQLIRGDDEADSVSRQGFAFGTITFPDDTTGHLLVIDATMVDHLPLDVHDYAESHPEFPHVSTGDQLFAERDFEAYRMLGRTITTQALESEDADQFKLHAERCTRS